MQLPIDRVGRLVLPETLCGALGLEAGGVVAESDTVVTDDRIFGLVDPTRR